MNITVAWEDVISVVQQISGYLIGAVALLAVLILVLIFAGKAGKPKAGMIRGQSAIVFIAGLAVIVNSILLNPMSDLINAATAETGVLSDETVENSRATVEEVAGEGIILTKNDDAALPLEQGSNLNVFGWASTNPVYGGTGSGTVDPTTAVSLLSGLENAGFTLNTELSDFYTEYRADRPVISINDGQDWTLPEPTADSYTQEMLDNAKSFSDTAVVVLARCGGEGADLPHDMGAVMDGSYDQGTKYTKAVYENNGDYDDFETGSTYLELSRTERDLVDLVCDNFEQVIVVYNGANALEMGWTEEYEQIKGVLLCASPGATGFNALGSILNGTVNPSGKTVDTWLKDVTAHPTYNNIGHFAYTNVEDVTSAALDAWEKADGIVSFVNYVEGIYVGYRFFETAYVEAEENGFDFDYDETVMYPFGYGLSYTDFSQEMGGIQENDGIISVDVTVTNTGDTAGKDVVELYYTPPYTNGGIEKAAVNLAAFDKTDLLEPGASQTLTLSFAMEDFASYDTYGTGHYVLEEGEYTVSLRTDAHTVVAEDTVEVADTIEYNQENLHNGDVEVADNKLDFAEGEITYLSRADGFANYEEAVAAPVDFEVHGTVTANGTYDPADYNDDSDEMPTTGAKNGLTLMDLRGADYDDARWEDLLDRVTVEEMVNLIAYGGFQTVAVDSIDKIATKDSDGPAGVNYFLNGSYGMGYCAEVLLAQTWNVDLAYKLADGIGRELVDFGFNGWYAPSMNLHRSPFGGRDFEYYSEDSLLSAEMAKQECDAVYEYGIYPYIKHFAFNEQETNRNAILCTWFNEQSARELYLKPFEECVKANEGQAMAVMSSYVYLGTEWAGGSTALLNDILRGEWGFRGLVLTDYFGNYGYMDADKAIRGGSDAMLGTAGNDAILTDQTSATSVLAMRQATKNILYTVVNSNAYSDENYEKAHAMPGWQKLLYGVDAGIVIVLAVLEILLIRNYKKKKGIVKIEVE